MDIERINRLLTVVQTLGASLEFDAFLQSVVEEVCELTSSESASILRYESGTDNLLFIAAPPEQLQFLRGVQVPLEGSAAGWVFRHAEPLLVQNTAHDKRHYKEVDRLTGARTRSILAAPLMFRGGPLGVLEAVNKRKGEYTEEDIAVLETLAALAAFSIHESELQKQIERLQAETSSLERLKADFIAIASHELRTPLGLILGHATFLRELTDKKYHEQLDLIIRNATRLKEIVDNLSSVDNYQSGAARVRQKQVVMTRLAQDVVESFHEEARRKGVDLRLAAPSSPLTAEGEAGKIEVALSHLVRNAITFTDSGGHVLVSVEAVPGYVKVSVTDDGIGIPASDLTRVFERFYQVENHLTRRYGGMGLGLSVAKAMVEMHGGRIWAESVEGQGSRFIFLLPINASQASAAEKVFIS
ncbi:MAG: GAF domain-containing sensor histidine kinase [Anaerolineales bacterium]|nr:MAG: GAF domain-containing sensor histidine kinase [Anaerolineales bacterium]